MRVILFERKKGGWNIACPKFPCLYHIGESYQCFFPRHFKDCQESHLSQTPWSLTPLQ